MNFLDSILEILKGLLQQGSTNKEEKNPSNTRQFSPKKELSENGYTLIDMLNSVGHEHASFCICDPDQQDYPIIFSSHGFCELTGYAHDEIEGKNCRFLQGNDTCKDEILRIRNAIREHKEINVNLLNYKKDGTPFNNEFFLLPLYNDEAKSKLVYFIGVQCSVNHLGPGQMPKNLGWVYANGIHS